MYTTTGTATTFGLKLNEDFRYSIKTNNLQLPMQ